MAVKSSGTRHELRWAARCEQAGAQPLGCKPGLSHTHNNTAASARQSMWAGSHAQQLRGAAQRNATQRNRMWTRHPTVGSPPSATHASSAAKRCSACRCKCAGAERRRGVRRVRERRGVAHRRDFGKRVAYHTRHNDGRPPHFQTEVVFLLLVLADGSPCTHLACTCWRRRCRRRCGEGGCTTADHQSTCLLPWRGGDSGSPPRGGSATARSRTR